METDISSLQKRILLCHPRVRWRRCVFFQYTAPSFNHGTMCGTVDSSVSPASPTNTLSLRVGETVVVISPPPPKTSRWELPRVFRTAMSGGSLSRFPTNFMREYLGSCYRILIYALTLWMPVSPLRSLRDAQKLNSLSSETMIVGNDRMF